MRKYYSNGSGKGGGADRMKSMAEKESDAYNKMRNEMDRQNFLKQRKEEMEQDKKKLNEKKYGIAVKDGGRIEYSKGTMPARNKKNFRSTKSGAGMTEAGVKAYRRLNPGSKLKTAVTGKVKPGSKAAKRRKSYCARSLGQLKRASAKTRNDPNSRIRQARRRWKC
jgi:hypothetical protein